MSDETRARENAPVFTREKNQKTRAPAARPVTPVVGYRRLITGTIPIAASGHPHRVRHRVELEPSSRTRERYYRRIAPPAGGAAESGPVYARPGPCSNSKIVNLACCKSAPGRELICPNAVLLQFMFAPAPRPALDVHETPLDPFSFQGVRAVRLGCACSRALRNGLRSSVSTIAPWRPTGQIRTTGRATTFSTGSGPHTRESVDRAGQSPRTKML